MATSEVFVLVSGMREEIIAHAQAGFPEEVCGIISGREGAAVELHRGRNVAPRPRTTYEMDVDTLMKQIEFDDAGLMLAAIYHSHPTGPSTPSPTDIARAAYPDSVYIICSLADPTQSSLRGFRIVDGTVWEVTLLDASVGILT
jgi:[CysO sulfur-carrier protein]-S-L-cysteine hydrolase